MHGFVYTIAITPGDEANVAKHLTEVQAVIAKSAPGKEIIMINRIVSK